MRLTLRTLLAYLDDTLEPSEIKQIGHKVAESDSAKELIGRIKQVTRRRRLTTPVDAGKGDKFDPNAVAAYLDNELSSEQVAEIEKTCLESDVHLAEIAACHQILTLVLGEPALVPPTAKERMYGLVKGREAIPFRKAPESGGAGADEPDDALQSVLAFHRDQQSWKRWVPLVAGGILFLALPFVLIYAVMPANNPPRDTSHLAQGTGKAPTDKDKEAAKDADVAKDAPPKDAPPKDAPPKDAPPKDTPPKDTPPKDAPPPPKDASVEPIDKPKPPVEPLAAPSKELREVAVFQGPAKEGTPTILVQRSNDQMKAWKRVSPNSGIQSNESLVSLPGYASEIWSNNKAVRLEMWGTLPELSQHYFLYESSVVLHANPKVDLDLTLEQGRIFLTNIKDKGAARIRLRFEKQIWDVVLAEPGSEVGVDLFKHYTRDIDWRNGEEPRAELKLSLLAGKGGLWANYYTGFPSLEMPGKSIFAWDNIGRGLLGPEYQEKPAPIWSRDVPANKTTNDLREALDAISKRLSKDKALSVMFKEVMADDNSPQPQRYVSICGMCAIDAISDVYDVLDSKDPARGADRNAAILLLRHWISRGDEYGKQLYDKDKKTGLLFDKTAKTNDAEIILDLLHDFDDARRQLPATFETLADYLTYNRMSIRELAYWHLIRLSVGAKTIPPFNAAWTPEQREQSSNQWKAMVKKGELPPQLPPPVPLPPK